MELDTKYKQHRSFVNFKSLASPASWIYAQMPFCNWQLQIELLLF